MCICFVILLLRAFWVVSRLLLSVCNRHHLDLFNFARVLLHYPLPFPQLWGDNPPGMSYGSLQPLSGLSLAQDTWLSPPDLGCPCCYRGMRCPRKGSAAMHSYQNYRKVNLKENHREWILGQREMGANNKMIHPSSFSPSHGDCPETQSLVHRL